MLPPTQNPNASQFYIGCVGSPMQKIHFGHAHFMLFVLISFVNMGLNFYNKPYICLVSFNTSFRHKNPSSSTPPGQKPWKPIKNTFIGLTMSSSYSCLSFHCQLERSSPFAAGKRTQQKNTSWGAGIWDCCLLLFPSVYL